METIKSSDTIPKEIASSELFSEFKISKWTFWIIAHVIAIPVATAFLFGIGDLLSFTRKFFPEIIASGLMYVVWGGVYGGIIGFVQWRYLKKRTAITSARWMYYCAIGIFAAEAMGVLVLLMFDIDRNIEIGPGSYSWLAWTLIHLTGGLIVGYLQSVYLKNITSNYKIWILGSCLSWGLAVLTWTGIISIFNPNILVVLFGGIVYGVVSAIFIHRLFKKKLEIILT